MIPEASYCYYNMHIVSEIGGQGWSIYWYSFANGHMTKHAKKKSDLVFQKPESTMFTDQLVQGDHVLQINIKKFCNLKSTFEDQPYSFKGNYYE